MTQIPAGWYPDPAQTHAARLRYWDGTGWTEHVHDPQPPAPAPAPYQSPSPAYPSYPEGQAQQYTQQYTQQYAQPYPDQYPPQYASQYTQPYGPTAGPTGYAPALPQPRTTPDGQPLSGWWRRVLAQLIDSLILSPVMIGIFAAFVAARWGEFSTWFDEYSRAVDAGRTPPPAPELFQPFSAEMFGMAAAYAVVLAVYTLGFWRWKQATPGKLAAGIRIRRRETPGPMPWSTMLPRFLFVQALAFAAYVPWVGFVALLVALLDVLWPLWDGRNQALHDKVARTNVVLAPPRVDEPSTAVLTAAGMPRRW